MIIKKEIEKLLLSYLSDLDDIDKTYYEEEYDGLHVEYKLECMDKFSEKIIMLGDYDEIRKLCSLICIEFYFDLIKNSLTKDELYFILEFLKEEELIDDVYIVERVYNSKLKTNPKVHKFMYDCFSYYDFFYFILNLEDGIVNFIIEFQKKNVNNNILKSNSNIYTSYLNLHPTLLRAALFNHNIKDYDNDKMIKKLFKRINEFLDYPTNNIYRIIIDMYNSDQRMTLDTIKPNDYKEDDKVIEMWNKFINGEIYQDKTIKDGLLLIFVENIIGCKLKSHNASEIINLIDKSYNKLNNKSFVISELKEVFCGIKSKYHKGRKGLKKFL